MKNNSTKKKLKNKTTNKKKVTQKKDNKKSKAFTLIELLAVIIILGVLLIIAVPSVTTYISDSRKNAYIATAKNYINSARNLVNSNGSNMYDTETTYYIPASCIATENQGESPYGKFNEAYVIVTYTGDGYKYSWASTDTSQMGILQTNEQDLDEKYVVSGVKSIDTSISMAPDKKISIMDSNTCVLGNQEESKSMFFTLGGDVTDDYNIEYQPLYFNQFNEITYLKKQNDLISTQALSDIYDSFNLGSQSGKVLSLFKIINDENFIKRGKISIAIPKVRDKKTEEEAKVTGWYYENTIRNINNERWICSGTVNETEVSCVPEEEYQATSSTYQDTSSHFNGTLYLLLENGNYIKIKRKYAAFGYFTYRFNDYVFPICYIYAQSLKN